MNYTKKNMSNSNDLLETINKKLTCYEDIIQKTSINIKRYKLLDIIDVNDSMICLNKLENINKKINDINKNKTKDIDDTINKLQIINNEMSLIIKTYGTQNLEDCIVICFGNTNFLNILKNDDYILEKYNLLKKYFHPISYKVLTKEDENIHDKVKTSSVLYKKSNILDCIDLSKNEKNFYMNVYGIQLRVCHNETNQCILITGILDDVNVFYLNNKYINKKIKTIKDDVPKTKEFEDVSFQNFLDSLNIKDYIICSSLDIFNKYMGFMNQINMIRKKPLSECVKEFIKGDLFIKRNTLIQLIIDFNNCENQYLAYLLYDILSYDTNENVDNTEQTILFDSFPWFIKKYFKDIIKNTIQYTNKMMNFDMNTIYFENQIILMKVDDYVKEKAVSKLREIKTKSEDSGSKARQFLEGLLKIPFGIYKKEPILYTMEKIRNLFMFLCSIKEIKNLLLKNNISIKDKYTNLEIINYVGLIKKKVVNENEKTKNFKKKIYSKKKDFLIDILSRINLFIEDKNDFCEKNKLNILKKSEITGRIDLFLSSCKELDLLDDFLSFVDLNCPDINNNEIKQSNKQSNKQSYKKVDYDLLRYDIKEFSIEEIVQKIEEIFMFIKNYLKNVRTILDESVYGHETAKIQIEKIIGQWINGEQSGYIFGFEGPPGVGKTSLAKYGLSKCLVDENGVSRPFEMIQIGGENNGSVLQGHNYTYVGSKWGSIVQILMDKKCMNPIIFIDEIDKISKTENGKEITGILTHLLDSTQNDCFQDKYFSGINIDLSKCLIILSYNDAENIDKILLDRIHRIKFDFLSTENKIIICKNYLLPEIYRNLGLEGVVQIEDSVLEFIIEKYTYESGVRKLKEHLYDLFREINLDVLKHEETQQLDKLHIVVNEEDIENRYFKKKYKIINKKIHKEDSVGIINCLWTNNLGQGGILSASSKLFPSGKFLELKLTGLLDDIMKESLNISLTNAYELLNLEEREVVHTKYDGDKKYGIHIHMGDGSVHKSGTSAGIAITLLVYSLLTNKKIKNNYAVTGEAGDLFGSSSEIGGLETKIIHGIKAGVKNFIFPKENELDFNTFMEKYKNNKIIEGVNFYAITNIKEAIELIIY